MRVPVVCAHTSCLYQVLRSDQSDLKTRVKDSDPSPVDIADEDKCLKRRRSDRLFIRSEEVIVWCSMEHVRGSRAVGPPVVEGRPAHWGLAHRPHEVPGEQRRKYRRQFRFGPDQPLLL